VSPIFSSRFCCVRFLRTRLVVHVFFKIPMYTGVKHDVTDGECLVAVAGDIGASPSLR